MAPKAMRELLAEMDVRNWLAHRSLQCFGAGIPVIIGRARSAVPFLGIEQATIMSVCWLM